MKILIYILLTFMLMSCEKEAEPEFTTVKKKYQYEGTYNGTIKVHCKTFSYDINSNNIVYVSSFDGERVFIENTLGTGTAFINGNHYQLTIDVLDESNCNPDDKVAIRYQWTGEFKGDSLIERGSFVLWNKGMPHSGTCIARSVKQN